ncbi:MAG TPA: copper resistance protein CopC [Vicinamibacterales bacterium]|nr:copper resistance protein CopC [Vicinamibacterales bacterium]
MAGVTAGETLMWRVVLTVAFALLSARTVNTHAELLRSDPPSGSVLATSPRQISLWFSEPIDTIPDSISVTAADGTRVDKRDAAVGGDPARLAASIELRAPGTYRVSWRVVSADGHPINGSFAFSLDRADPSVSALVPPEDDQAARLLQPIGRWLHLIAVVILSGSVLMLVLLGRDIEASLADRLWRFARAGAVFAVPAALVMLISQATAIRGSVGEALEVPALREALQTHWGALWAVRGLLVVSLIAFTHWMARAHSLASGSRLPGLSIVGAALAGVVLATALNGHSAVTPPFVLSVAVDWVHLAATGAWTGGLLTLSICVLPWLKTAEPRQRRTLLKRVVLRFSTVALVAVELLILTGLYHTWAHVAGPEAFTSTPYGQTLLLKIGLIAVTLLPAAINLLVVRPRLAVLELGTDHDNWSRRFARLVTAEAVLAVGIVAAAAVLTSIPDGRVLARELQVPGEFETLPQRSLVANAARP